MKLDIINNNMGVLKEHSNPLKKILLKILPTKWSSSIKFLQTETLKLANRFRRLLPNRYNVTWMNEVHAPLSDPLPIEWAKDFKGQPLSTSGNRLQFNGDVPPNVPNSYQVEPSALPYESSGYSF